MSQYFVETYLWNWANPNNVSRERTQVLWCCNNGILVGVCRWWNPSTDCWRQWTLTRCSTLWIGIQATTCLSLTTSRSELSTLPVQYVAMSGFLLFCETRIFNLSQVLLEIIQSVFLSLSKTMWGLFLPCFYLYNKKIYYSLVVRWARC